MPFKIMSPISQRSLYLLFNFTILRLTSKLPDKSWKPVYDLLRPVRMRVTWAVSFPRLFSATHSYLPASLISMLCMNRSPEDNTVARGSVSAAIPNVLYHVIRGSGIPSARHVKVTFPPNVTCFSEGGLVIVGGTTN